MEFVNKADLSSMQNRQVFISELILKIKIASIAKVGKKNVPGHPRAIEKQNVPINQNESIIAIGASTGGTEAVYALLGKLNRDLPGIVIVQHMPPVFTKLYAERLNKAFPLDVKEAVNGDKIMPGCVYIAPGSFHMQVLKSAHGYQIKCFEGERVNGHCPSVDVLFESVAKTFGSKALGIILTGMGGDGAQGLLTMRKQGAATLGQDQESCVVYGMPMVAKQLGAVETECPLLSMPAKVYQWRQAHQSI